jgi:hypothetical protein
MQLVPIPSNVVSTNPACGEVYSIQHYVIKVCPYAPIVGINDRGDIMWSGTRYWLRSYICGPKRQRCDMAHGSMEKL